MRLSRKPWDSLRSVLRGSGKGKPLCHHWFVCARVSAVAAKSAVGVEQPGVRFDMWREGDTRVVSTISEECALRTGPGRGPEAATSAAWGTCGTRGSTTSPKSAAAATRGRRHRCGAPAWWSCRGQRRWAGDPLGRPSACNWCVMGRRTLATSPRDIMASRHCIVQAVLRPRLWLHV